MLGRLGSRFFIPLLLLPADAAAHSFGKVYTLPMPLHIYLAAVSFALLLSTMAAVWILKVGHTTNPHISVKPNQVGPAHENNSLGSWPWLTIVLLMSCMLTSAVGSKNPYLNIGMNLFWIDFLLLFFYVNFFLNNFRSLNPWQGIVFLLWNKLRGVLPRHSQENPVPAYLAIFPLFNMLALFSIELLTHANPRALAIFLLLYLLVTIYGVAQIGPARWFKDYDFFNLFFGVFTIARLKDSQPLRPLEILIVFFVLATTTFDGIKETLLWLSIYWGSFYQSVLSGIFGFDYSADFKLLQVVFTAFEAFTLIVVAPLAYILVFAMFCLGITRTLSAKKQIKKVFLGATRSVIPIVVTYHAAHYLSLLGEQAFQFPFMLADPFGWGWFPEISNLRLALSWTFRPEWVWHLQVLMILAGHAWGGILIHQTIAEFTSSPNRIRVAHFGALLLMISLTTIGLWVLSLPINPNS